MSRREDGVRRLIYSSLASEPMQAQELEEMLTWSRMLNEANGITGLLLYFPPELTDQPSFLQLLEGEADVVEATYDRIARDARHHDVRLVSLRDVEQRLFPQWSMGLDFVTRAQLAKALPGRPDSPHAMVAVAEIVEDAARAEAMLLEHCG
jgi:hypothetical protein